MKPWRPVLLCWVLVLCSCVCERAPVAHVPGPPREFHTMAIGLCEDYPKEGRSLGAARQDLQACRDAGVSTLRIAFSWLDMEPREGAYDFSFWDDFVRMATGEFHLRLIPYVCYTPQWAASEPGPDFWHSPPRDVEAFARFVEALVERYGPHGSGAIHSWELWNEPDNRAYWTGTPGGFAQLLLAGSGAVRGADATAIVVFGGVAGTPSFLNEVLNVPGVNEAVDVVNFHAYFETWHEDGIETVGTYINKMHDIVQRHGGRQRLWMAEVGYSDFRQGARVSDQYAARFAFEHTAAFQADVLKRVGIEVAATGRVDLFAWYRINDLPAETNVIGDVNNRHLGIRDSAGRRKPSFAAIEEITGLLSRPLACVDEAAWAMRPLASDAEVHIFVAADGSGFVAGWRKTDVPGLAVEDAESPVPIDVWWRSRWLRLSLSRDRTLIVPLGS